MTPAMPIGESQNHCDHLLRSVPIETNHAIAKRCFMLMAKPVQYGTQQVTMQQVKMCT